MIRNYLTVAFRNFLKHKSFTFLNVVGLSIGLMASLLILQYVKYERSYDTFHSNAKNIYREKLARFCFLSQGLQWC